MSRVLTARPSNAEDMAPWQITLSNKLQDLLQEAHLKRTVLTHFIKSFPRPTGEQAIENGKAHDRKRAPWDAGILEKGNGTQISDRAAKQTP